LVGVEPGPPEDGNIHDHVEGGAERGGGDHHRNNVACRQPDRRYGGRFHKHTEHERPHRSETPDDVRGAACQDTGDAGHPEHRASRSLIEASVAHGVDGEGPERGATKSDEQGAGKHRQRGAAKQGSTALRPHRVVDAASAGSTA
jgi:hypothetical protein